MRDPTPEHNAATAEALVGNFRSSQDRLSVFQRLLTFGPDALPALRNGLKSDDWQTRRWSAICMDHLADSRALSDLVPLLTDHHPKVRLWAVHALACDHCKDDVQCEFDIVPLLIERVRTDPSLPVRKMAVIMLAREIRDARCLPVLAEVLATESDRRIRLHAEEGIKSVA